MLRPRTIARTTAAFVSRCVSEVSAQPVKKQSLFLIDGSNNVYRSYFAIRGLTNSAGLATNAVYGFITTLKKLLKDHDPDYIAVAFDIGSAKERHEAFADYKKDRRPMQIGRAHV